MAIFKALTFDGVNSLDYGIYITGEAVYNAPERAVEMVNIPGKNGALALDQGRFENIEVTYHAGCFADSQADFADKVMRFRNALASRYTYKRLTDEYHPDEYRLGLYKSGLEVDAVHYSTAGEFDITFDCKPQRFLIDGDREILPTEWTDLHTVTGDIVTVENPNGILAVKSLEVDLEPIQDLNGYDKPWVGGAGKNKLPSRNGTVTNGGLTFSCNGDGVYHISGTSTSTYPQWLIENGTLTLPVGTTFTLSNTVTNAPSGASIYCILYERDTPTGTNLASRSTKGRNSITFTIEHPYQAVVVVAEGNGLTYNNATITPQIEVGSTATAYEPYSNICPISGRTEVVTSVSPTTSAQDATSHTTDLGQTVYGGTLDVVTGELVVDRAMEIVDASRISNNGTLPYGGLQILYNPLTTKKYGTQAEPYHGLLSNRFYPNNASILGEVNGRPTNGNIYFNMPSSATTVELARQWFADNPTQISYELANPQTVQLSPQQVQLLLGTNHLWSDGGEITVTYGVHPYYNPSPFDAKPLIKVTGRGTLGIGEYILTITGTESQTLYIDCETMEIYTLEGTVPTGASSLVSINRNDFPVLEPGTNNISVGSGITAVTITPRWWRI